MIRYYTIGDRWYAVPERSELVDWDRVQFAMTQQPPVYHVQEFILATLEQLHGAKAVEQAFPPWGVA